VAVFLENPIMAVLPQAMAGSHRAADGAVHCVVPVDVAS